MSILPTSGKVGFVCGAWDLLHVGHMALLRSCKDYCDYLYVGLHVDPSIERPGKNRPIQSMFERYSQLAVLGLITCIIPYETEADLLDLLALYRVDIRFLGTDYKDRDFTGKDFCLEYGIELKYIPRYHSFSSSELRRRIKSS